MVYRQTVRHTDALITNLQYFATSSGVYGFCRLTAATTLTANIIDCVEAATSCMRSNRLRPNPDKTEFLCCASVRRQHQLPINVTAADRRLLHHSGPVCSRPRHLRRLRFVEADACSTYRVALLCCATSSTSDTSLCTVGHTATLQMLVVALVHSRPDYGNGVLVGLPAHLMRRLQSVLNAAARLIYRLRTRDHMTGALISLHWLRVAERIQYKLATLAYRVLHGDAPRYLGPLIRVDDLPGRRPLRSTNINRLVVPQVKLSTVSSRAFAVAAADIWNRLPTDVVAANSLSTFRRLLKRFLFRQSYPDVVYWLHPISGPCSGCAT